MTKEFIEAAVNRARAARGEDANWKADEDGVLGLSEADYATAKGALLIDDGYRSLLQAADARDARIIQQKYGTKPHET